MATEFGDWILARLAEKDWTQAQLARRAHTTRQVINNYINEPRENPDKDILAGIAKALGEPPETVFRAAGLLPELPTPDAERKERLDHSWSELTPQEQDDVLSYIEFRKTRKLPITILASPAITPHKKRQGKRPGEVVK